MNTTIQVLFPAYPHGKTEYVDSRPNARVLVAAENMSLINLALSILTVEGYDVCTAAGAEAAMTLVKREPADLILCDDAPPAQFGLTLTRQIRDVSDTPVCVLSDTDTLEGRIASFEAGADDHLVKPFDSREFALRVAALLRRSRAAVTSRRIVNGFLTIDPMTRSAWVGDRRIELNDVETRLLVTLAEHRNRPVEWRHLVSTAWLTDNPDTGHAMLKTTVHRLRRALGETTAGVIVAIRGYGYLMPTLPDHWTGVSPYGRSTPARRDNHQG